MLNFLNKYKIYLIIVLIIGGLIGWSNYTKANKKIDYITDKVTLGTVSDFVTESGNITTEGQANIVSSAEGVVEEMLVENNDQVNAGQALFTVKSTSTDLDKATAQSSFLSAQNNTNTSIQTKNSYGSGVETAKKTLYDAQTSYANVKRWFILHSTNATTGRKYTQIDVNAAAAALKAAEENLTIAEQKYADADLAIEAARAAEDVAQQNYDNKNIFTVKAPSSGKVSNININVGDKVGGVTTGTTANPSMIISKSKVLTFKTMINEIDITKLKIDQPAEITVDAIKNQTFKGKIYQIDEIGTNSAGVISYGVYFSIDSQEAAMRAGMSGSISVEAQKHENVLTAINSAIKPYQGGKAVQILQDQTIKGKTKKVLTYIPVKVGLKGLERTEITSGSTAGQEVIVAVNSAAKAKSFLNGGN
jgi:multidrug resistance efflux pump